MGYRRQIMLPLLGDGIFTQEGAVWKHSRELLRPQFVHKQYDNLEIFKEAVDDLIEVVSQEDGVMDLQPLFFRLTLDVTTAFLFGESTRSLRAHVSAGEQTFTSSFATAQEYIAKRFRLLNLYWLIGGEKFKQACDRVHHFADQIIDRSLSRGFTEDAKVAKYVFLDSLARKTPDRTALRGQIINLLTAGRDTTACLLTWTL